MKRVIILVLDSFGIGCTPDAHHYGDEGANTFAHIAAACHDGRADSDQRQGPLKIPHLLRWGLVHAAAQHQPLLLDYFQWLPAPEAAYGSAQEISHGKDTPSGHWEIAGLPVLYKWGYFPDTHPSFPEEFTQALIQQGKLEGILGDKHESGTVIIDEYGETHMLTGKPIVYTSADSVLQIAAHEETFGLERLYKLCLLAKTLSEKYQIARVIARPFLGTPGNFYRTANRRDYTTPPHDLTLLNYVEASGHEVYAIGKISDIFAHSGVSKTLKAPDNMAMFDRTLEAMETAQDGDLIFTNFVDFDTLYGHRRNISGYAKALEDFDRRLPELEEQLQPGDRVIITADHGCDPTWVGSGHTREYIPILLKGLGVNGIDLGRRSTFADIGQSIATYLGIGPLKYGKTFMNNKGGCVNDCNP